MPYYDYSSYFQNIISHQNMLQVSLDKGVLFIQLLCFMFACYFVWKFVSSMLKGRW